ncbi:MAG: hypothetical protein FRX48_09402 [Lasallia pustulata]|uniref:Uncharacterized protein n=1 Tax=Lasallia pustulata TaxID=136370 RepID=A0A5M8PBJ6_9LECA|nr:MAG: hypothetical protein FRX48_09402 [Lasallia pustulata]
MVLDESPASPTDFTSDYPTSDSDPYASSSETPQLSIDLDQLPSAAPIIGPLFGYTTQNLVASIHLRVQQASRLLQRPVTQDELTALSYWTARTTAIASWGPPLGVAAGCWRAYQIRDTFKFPFVKPDPAKFNPEAIKLFGVELARGMRARMIWHGLRGGAYGVFGSLVGGMVVGSYAMTVTAVGEQQDPRLREVIAKLRVKAREAVAEMQRERQGQVVGQKGDPTGQGQTSASELWKNHRRGIRGDDASPTAGNTEGVDYAADADDARLARSEGGVLSDQQMHGQEMRQQASPRQSPTENRTSTFQVEKVERQPRTFDDDYDDASPTAGSGSTDAGGSVWEQIRKEASSTRSNGGRRRRATERVTVQREPQDAPTTGDSFAYSSSEAEKHLAKEEAQRVFDEQVERERRGGDFGGKRW